MVDPKNFEKSLHELQRALTARLETIDGKATFLVDRWGKTDDFGGTSMVLSDGAVFERAGVNFSKVGGPRLPSTASERHPHLAGSPFEVRGVSVVIHPQNPFVPTAHMNVRLFTVLGEQPTYWFGGGFDLTPYYGFEEDARDFHRAAKQACDALHRDAYARYKKTCDEYFFLKHRGEPRGIGGIFFDDLGPSDAMTQSIEHAERFVTSVGEAFTRVYCAIAERRQKQPFSDEHRQWQLYRRGRYVEFNLVYDRGTTFGLQTGGRTESILMSLPPLVRWVYDYKPAPGSEEARLHSDFLRPRAWLDE